MSGILYLQHFTTILAMWELVGWMSDAFHTVTALIIFGYLKKKTSIPVTFWSLGLHSVPVGIIFSGGLFII